MPADLTIIVLSYNEEIHLHRLLSSVKDLCVEIILVDSGSSDGTLSIANQFGVKVVYHPFENQAKQFQWALDNIAISTSWVMRLDADELIDAELAREITYRLPLLSGDICGVNLRRKHIFMNRWVRHGGRYPLIMLRIFRLGKGRVEDRWMDEHITVTEGRTITFESDFADHNLNDLSYFTDKHNKYATREAIEVLNQRLNFFSHDFELSAQNSSTHVAFKRWIKERVYNRFPFFFSATLYFLWRYIFQLGFLDGRSGLIYHFLQGFWYRFLVGAKVMELEHAISHLSDKNEICAELGRLTGLKL